MTDNSMSTENWTPSYRVYNLPTRSISYPSLHIVEAIGLALANNGSSSDVWHT